MKGKQDNSKSEVEDEGLPLYASVAPSVIQEAPNPDLQWQLNQIAGVHPVVGGSGAAILLFSHMSFPGGQSYRQMALFVEKRL